MVDYILRGERQINVTNHTTRVLADLMSSAVCTDVSIKVSEGDVFKCHRAVLAVSSEYFKVMFEFDEIRATSLNDLKHEVSLVAIDANTFKKIVQFMYTGTISLLKRDVVDIFKAADYLQITELAEHCALFLHDCVDLDNWQQLWDASILYGKQSMVESVECFILDHMEDIVGCLGTFVHELESKFKERSMEVHLTKLRKLEAHLTKLRELRDRSQECDVGEDCMLLIPVNEWFGKKTIIPCYCESMNSWMELTRMPDIGDRFQCVVVTVVPGLLYFTGGLYFIAGTSIRRSSNQCHSFDVVNLQWRRCAPMMDARKNHSAVAVGSDLLVVGGLDDRSLRGEMYNAVADQWTRVETFEHLHRVDAGDMAMSSADNMFRQMYSNYCKSSHYVEESVDYEHEYIMFTLGSVVQILEKKFVAYCTSVSDKLAIVQLETGKKTIGKCQAVWLKAPVTEVSELRTINALHVQGHQAIFVTRPVITFCDFGSTVFTISIFVFDSQRLCIDHIRDVDHCPWPGSNEFVNPFKGGVIGFTFSSLYCLVDKGSFDEFGRTIKHIATLRKLDMNESSSVWSDVAEFNCQWSHFDRPKALLSMSVPRHSVLRLRVLE